MKYLAAFVATANAAAYTICSFTQTYYANSDTACAAAAAATSTILALVNVCSYNAEKTRWYKITACTMAKVDWQWHTTAACSDTPAAAAKTAYTAVNTCVSINHDGSTAAKSKIATLAGATSKTLCGATITQHADNACANADATVPTFPNRGLPAAGGVWIVGQCYYFGKASQYMKFTICTSASVFTILFYTNATCGTAVSGAGVKVECTAAAPCTGNKKCLDYFSNGAKYGLFASVVHSNTITQPAAAAAAAAATTTTAAATTTDGARTLVIGSLAALSLAYL